jgi:hypothetical protein
MRGRWLSVAGWCALAATTAFSCSSANASQALGVDPNDDARAGASRVVTVTSVRFDLVRSHDGIRSVVLDEGGGRRTALGDVPADATCESYASPPHDSYTPHMRLWCGAALDVWVFAARSALEVRGQYDFLREGPFLDDDLPVPDGANIELDPSLYDPGPPSCGQTHERAIELSLTHVARPKEGRYEMEDVTLQADLGPTEAHMSTPWCKRHCLGKGEPTAHHYEYMCSCDSEPYDGFILADIRGGRFYVQEIERMPETGSARTRGIWSVPCGGHLEYPPGTRIVSYHEEYFGDTPEEAQAKEESYEDAAREDGVEWKPGASWPAPLPTP